MTEPHDEALKKLLLEGKRASFGPGFTDRVMRRVDAEQTSPLAAIMPAEFFRLAAVALLIAVALIAFNVAGGDIDSAQTTLEAAFGLQPLTADSVYDLAAIFSAEAVAAS